MFEYQQKLKNIDKKLNYLPLHQQVAAIDAIIAQLENKKALTKQAPKLGFLPDALAEMINEVGADKVALCQAANELLNNFRSFISRQFGIWSLANLETAQAIVEEYHVKTGLEVMAGNACWSKALSQVGVKMRATDSFSWSKGSQTGSSLFFPTQNMPAAQAIKRYTDVDLIICCWAPNFGKSDVSVLAAYRQLINSNAKLLFVAEKDGATNTPQFWQSAKIVKSESIRKINQTFPNFDFIDERFYEIK